jgi:hypothetical protein
MDGQIEVINRMIMHILCMYNSKYPYTWDESIPYVQHNYKKSIHISVDHNPFQVGLGFQPLDPMDVELPLTTTQEDSLHAPNVADKATWFIKPYKATYFINPYMDVGPRPSFGETLERFYHFLDFDVVIEEGAPRQS